MSSDHVGLLRDFDLLGLVPIGSESLSVLFDESTNEFVKIFGSSGFISLPMIKKEYRLKEREIRKVLSRKKPFFSYSFIANVLSSREGKSRFAVVFSGKNTNGSVDRNFFRRRFYELTRPYLTAGAFDIVFVPKKWQKFDPSNSSTLQSFDADITSLLRKIFAS